MAKRNSLKHVWHIREFGCNGVYSYMGNPFKYVNRNSNTVIAISNSLARYCNKKGIDREKITMIYDGVECSEIQPIDKHYQEKVKLVMVGNLSKEKGIDTVINAISALCNIDDVQLDIYGSGSEVEKNYLQTLIREHSLEKCVKLKGYSSKLKDILPKYDVGIVASKTEGFGRITIEYYAAGLWTLGTNTGATPELIEQTQAGWLFNYQNEEELTRLIEKVIKEKPVIFPNKQIVNNFSPKKNAENVYATFERTLNG